jgi:hypothetical protein
VRKLIILVSFFTVYGAASAQKIESIYFNLYTDSLKKGFYNYISIDGRSSDGKWMPLDSTQVTLLSNEGFFKGNDLFIDSSYKGETVKIKAILKSNPSMVKETIIYIRKRGFDEPLKTNEEILNDMRSNPKKKNPPKRNGGLIS